MKNYRIVILMLLIAGCNSQKENNSFLFHMNK